MKTDAERLNALFTAGKAPSCGTCVFSGGRTMSGAEITDGMLRCHRNAPGVSRLLAEVRPAFWCGEWHKRLGPVSES